MVDHSIAQQLETGNVQRLILKHRAIHRIRVDATDLSPALAKILGEDACDKRLADTAFALQRQVNGVAVVLCNGFAASVSGFGGNLCHYCGLCHMS
jgi:hypothetical protein